MTPKEAVDLNRFRTITLKEQKLYRLIPSRFPPVDLYERVAERECWGEIFALEEKTNPRLRKAAEAGDNAAPAQNWNAAPFAYPKPRGTSFTRPRDTALVAFSTQEAALWMSLVQRAAFLFECDMPPTKVITRLLVTPVTGCFLDWTDQDMTEDRAERVEIAERCRLTDGVDGVAFRHPDYPHADAYCILKEPVLGQTCQSRHFSYTWNGDKFTEVHDSSLSNDPRESAIDIDALKSGAPVLAA
ncbi:MAG: hypothetical protein V7741_00250 [Hyphomonas sp.]